MRIPIATALIDTLRTGYTGEDLWHDLMAGVTIGIVAVPLAMALAIAAGVAPQYGLYSSVVAGAIIAVTGGARFNVSGPTAAFVVILLPITAEHGVGGLLVTTVMAGVILLAMGLSGMGRLIQFIPYPVTTGFTAGIAVVIATLQLKDFFGLDLATLPEHFLEKLWVMIQALPSLQASDVSIGVLTLAVLVAWPRLKTGIPGHLVALVLGTLAAWAAPALISGFEVATVASRFTYAVGDATGQGIPPLPPLPLLPWNLPDAQGQPLELSISLLRELFPAALTIAMLGAIESLLCAVVADGLAGTRHDPNAELVGQGLGNLIAPFFGGMTATAAIARTATNVRSGARSPVAALVHAGVVLLALVSLAGLLGYVPMSALAALLLVVAWNMAEVPHVINMARRAPASDVIVLFTCFGLTVLFDMVLAVGVGVVLASLLFIGRMSALTSGSLLAPDHSVKTLDLPPAIAVYDVNGPLFFGAAEKAIGALHSVDSDIEVIIIDMADVPAIDMTGIVALQSLLARLEQDHVAVVIGSLSPRIYRKLLKAGLRKKPGKLAFRSDWDKARCTALSFWRPGDDDGATAD